jgi:transcriptional regulator with AAA-type ATPase domain
MLFATAAETALATAISKLAYCNPFLPERIECERAVLGDQFVNSDIVWSVGKDAEGNRPNIPRLAEKVENLTVLLRQRLLQGVRTTEREHRLYEDLVAYLLYYRVHSTFMQVVTAQVQKPQAHIAKLYDRFKEDSAHFLHIPGVNRDPGIETPHLFAIYFQIRRAFHHIFQNIVGSSMPAARLRAAIWQSIFTHDIARYRRTLFGKMSDLTTLITGPSGTGKELVARAIAFSPYIPFDPKTRSFAGDFSGLFHPLNLSAMSPTLVESELFGHRRGSFTGALEDREGWLDVCQTVGTVFLDEIGELSASIQVKLLRVLQSRQFERLGDTKPRQFRGKIIAATNLDLAREMAAGRFRRDFYYRICSDIIVTPSLREQLEQSPQDLKEMVLFIARRVSNDEAEPLAEEVTTWVGKNLGHDYPWPGNFRELEQCVRNVLIRHEYRPQAYSPMDAAEKLAQDINAGSLTADQLLRRYCTLIYGQTKNYEETARRLGLDRRTVKSKVDANSDDMG